MPTKVKNPSKKVVDFVKAGTGVVVAKIPNVKVKYVKLREDDNWGHITTFAGKEEFSVPRSGKMYVLFPDGTEELVTVKMCGYVEHISDSGQSYTAGGEVPHAFFNYHGQSLDIRLAHSKLKVAVIS